MERELTTKIGGFDPWATAGRGAMPGPVGRALPPAWIMEDEDLDEDEFSEEGFGDDEQDDDDFLEDDDDFDDDDEGEEDGDDDGDDDDDDF